MKLSSILTLLATMAAAPAALASPAGAPEVAADAMLVERATCPDGTGHIRGSPCNKPNLKSCACDGADVVSPHLKSASMPFDRLLSFSHQLRGSGSSILAFDIVHFSTYLGLCLTKLIGRSNARVVPGGSSDHCSKGQKCGRRGNGPVCV